MAHIVQHQECGATATITEDGVDIHEAVDAAGCACCPQDHKHTGECRPVHVILLAGSAPITPGA
jgi:hypothetical protein